VSVKLIAIYDQPADSAAFFKHYENVHSPLVSGTPGLQRLSVSRISGNALGGPSPYIAIAEMTYANREALDRAMKSSENQAVVDDLMKFTQGKVRVFVADSDEE
jgi:uncharacterized protein (TIGR02118 family)